MTELDNTSSLFEHIRNRLPTGYGLGDDGTVIKDGVPNHSVFQQSLREDHEGDVGIFETQTSEYKLGYGAKCWQAKTQFGVVTKQGDIENAKNYLLEAFENIKKNKKSTAISVNDYELIDLMGVGKNGKGYQMVTMNVIIRYTKNKL